MPDSYTDNLDGSIEIEFGLEGDRTVVAMQRCHGLLTCSRAMYIADSWRPELKLVHLGPGVMAGDRYEQRLKLTEGTKADIGYQSFSKILPGAQLSCVHTTITLEPNTSLKMRPNVILPYQGTNHKATTDIYVQGNAQAIWTEICMLPPNTEGNLLSLQQFSTIFRIYREGKLAVRDSLKLGHETLTCGRKWDVQYPVVGTMYVIGNVRNIEVMRKKWWGICEESRSSTLQIGMTTTDGSGVIVRMLADRVQTVEAFSQRIQNSFNQPKAI